MRLFAKHKHNIAGDNRQVLRHGNHHRVASYPLQISSHIHLTVNWKYKRNSANWIALRNWKMVHFSQHHLIAFVLLNVNMMLQLVVPANAFLLRPSIPSKTPFSQSIRYYQQKQQQSTTLTATRHPLADAAAQLLPWEQLASAQDKPILNLSGRDDSPEDVNNSQKKRVLDTSAWDTGERWQNTWSHLCEVLPLLLLTSSSVSQEEYSEDGASLFVTQCPQLLRFESDHIRETASFIQEAVSRM